MSIVAIGLNNTSASLELLEQLSVRGDDLVKSFDDLLGRNNLSEVVRSEEHTSELQSH